MTRHPLPVALADQLAAAARDARRHLHNAARASRGRLVEGHPAPWLADHVRALLDALSAGTARVCPHVGPSPRVVHAAMWAPGVLVCSTCVALLAPTTATEDNTCDHCRRHVRRIHAGTAAFGPILLGYGLCPACLRTTGLARKDTA